MKLRQVKLSGESPSRTRMTITVTVTLLFAVAVSLHIVNSAAVVSPPATPDELQIELSSNGFTPNAAQHAPGTFGITVENTVLAGEYILRLKAADGTVVKEVPVEKGSAAWTVTLQPGDGAEIKAYMARGRRFVFTWTAAGGAVNFDMHGEPTNAKPDEFLNRKTGISALATTREGGQTIDYRDEDPFVRQQFAAKLAEVGLKSTMPQEVYTKGAPQAEGNTGF